MSNELQHFGVKGMKWGVRKDSHLAVPNKITGSTNGRITKTLTTKSGDSITLSESPSSMMSKFLSRYSKKAAEERSKTAFFDIKAPDGKRVGDITLYKESDDSINVVWVTTKDSVRGRGYGTSVMNAAISMARETNCKRVTLEVPGDSPDARHIYEKLGFKEAPTPDSDPDDVWGGLTNMQLDLSEIRHDRLAHSSLSDLSDSAINTFMNELSKEVDDMSNELQHFGVKGMKWGVRRSVGPDGAVSSRPKAPRTPSNRKIKSARRKDVRNRRKMSDKDLMEKIGRLEKEKKLRELTDADIRPGKKAMGDILKTAGARTLTTVAAGATLYGVKYILTGKVDPSDLAGYVAPKPGKK